MDNFSSTYRSGQYISSTNLVTEETDKFEKGWIAFKAGDYDIALNYWLPLAEDGHAAAQFNVGFMCERGRSLTVQEEAAVEWYKLSAKQGYAKAVYALELMQR